MDNKGIGGMMRNIKEIGGNKGRMVSVFKESMKICSDGAWGYKVGDKWIDIREGLENSLYNTSMYLGEINNIKELWELKKYRRKDCKMKIEVTQESTVECGKRLWEEGSRGYCALNFASAVNVGGGVLYGAVAQEEDLCRSSGLYICLSEGDVGEYYERNRKSLGGSGSINGVYTDCMIYSPDVVFFRDGELNLIDDPFLMSIVTSPAPCVRDMDMEDEGLRKYIRGILFTRMEKILSLMVVEGNREIILGAWGCGAFGNRASDVARMFRIVLEDFGGMFDRVIFAIKADSDLDENYVAFKREFDGI